MLKHYIEDQFEYKWEELVANHHVQNHEWVKKVYSDKHIWAKPFLKGKFSGGMRSTQRSESMNAFLNHYVSVRLRLISFVKQMDRLMDRQREAEGNDDFDSNDGSPVSRTHMKAYEEQI